MNICVKESIGNYSKQINAANTLQNLLSSPMADKLQRMKPIEALGNIDKERIEYAIEFYCAKDALTKNTYELTNHVLSALTYIADNYKKIDKKEMKRWLDIISKNVSDFFDDSSGIETFADHVKHYNSLVKENLGGAKKMQAAAKLYALLKGETFTPEPLPDTIEDIVVEYVMPSDISAKELRAEALRKKKNYTDAKSLVDDSLELLSITVGLLRC